jgi:hypothetical protein
MDFSNGKLPEFFAVARFQNPERGRPRPQQRTDD